MKKFSTLFLVLAGLLLAPVVSWAQTEEPVATPVATDTVATPEMALPAEKIAKDHELAMAQLEFKKATMYASSRFVEELPAVIITFMVLGAIVWVVFLVMKYFYRSRQKRFELEKLWIERGGDWPLNKEEGRQTSAMKFIKGLLIVSIVCWVFVGFVTLINARYGNLLQIAILLLAALGWAIVTLVRLYLNRSSGKDE